MSFLNRNRDRYKRGLTAHARRRNDAYVRRFGLYQNLGGTFSEETISDADLLECSMNEPVGHRLTYVVARDTVNCGYDVLRDDGKIHNYNTSIQNSFEEYDMMQVGVYAYQLERIYGRSWLVKIDPEKHQKWEGDEIVYTAFSNPSLASNTKHTWDKFGNYKPLDFMVKYRDGRDSVKLTIKPEDYYFVLTRQINSTDGGLPILQPCWNDIVNLRIMRTAFTERIRKYGGFPHIKVIGANDFVLQQAQIKWGDFDELKEAWSNEETDIDMKGLQGVALDPNKFLEPYIKQIAISTGMPVPLLMGMESGMLKSGQINMSNYYALINNNQQSLDDMAGWMAKSVHDTLTKFNIKWRLEYAISDIDRLSMRQIEVDNAVKLRPYVTDEAFARMLKMDEEDIEEDYQEKQNPFGMGGGFGNQPKDNVKSSNEVTEGTGRDLGDKKEKNLRKVS